MRVLLLGDSHLARLGPDDLVGLAARVTNAAVGGALATDLAGQLAAIDLGTHDAVVVSVGTNDAAPWQQVPLDDFGRTLAASLPPLPLVYVAPPGVDEARTRRGVDRTVALLARWSAVGRAVVERAGGVVVETPVLLAPLGSAAFVDDGLHLTRAAYDLLVPAIAEALGTAGAPAS